MAEGFTPNAGVPLTDGKNDDIDLDQFNFKDIYFELMGHEHKDKMKNEKGAILNDFGTPFSSSSQPWHSIFSDDGTLEYDSKDTSFQATNPVVSNDEQIGAILKYFGTPSSSSIQPGHSTSSDDATLEYDSEDTSSQTTTPVDSNDEQIDRMMSSQNKFYSIQCLKDLMEYCHYSTEDVDGENPIALLIQLREFVEYVESKQESDNWDEWKSEYWKVVTDPELNVNHTNTRFIVALKFMERNLFTGEKYNEWIAFKQKEWLKKCDDSIDIADEMSFYFELLHDIDSVLKKFEYDSFEDYDKATNEVISSLNFAAQELHKVAKGTGIATTTAGGLGIVSGVLGAIGLGLAPVTAGASLILTATSIGIGVGSAATSITSNQVHNISEKKKEAKLENEIKNVIKVTQVLNELVDNFSSSIDNYKTMLDSLRDSNAFKVLKQTTTAGCQLYTVIGGMVKVGKIARTIKLGVSAEAALDAATPIRTAITGGSKVSTALGGVFVGLSLLGGIWETVVGAKRIKNGSIVAKKFTDLAEDLSSAKIRIAYACQVAEQALAAIMEAN